MNLISHRIALGIGLPALAAALFLPAQVVRAQQVRADRGFSYKAEALASGDERNSQEALWALEVQYKSLRMIYIDLTDPKTGKKKKELVWYLVYKALNRPFEGQQDDSDKTPVNQFDKPPNEKPIFVPEFTLLTDDNGVQRIFEDEILLEAQAAIIKRERQSLRNSVEAVGPIPEPTPIDAPKAEENAIYGLAMWRGMNPETDYFTIFLSGFSNGYRYVKGPVSYGQLSELVNNGELLPSDQVWDGKSDWVTASNQGDLFDKTKQPPENFDTTSWYYTSTSDRFGSDGPPPVWRKTLILKYWRPGDRFRQDESEVKPIGDSKWIYRISEPPKVSLVANEPAKAGATAPSAPPKNPASRNAFSDFFKQLDKTLKSGAPDSR